MGDAKVLDEGLAALPGRIRRSRQERGWTLERLASETALSKAYLGRLEAGERQPSLSALLALSRAFGCSVSDLVGEPSPTGETVVRGAAAVEQRGNGLRYRLLSPSDARGGIEAMRVVVPADRPVGAKYEHAGQEWLYVLSGRLRLTLGDTEAVLETGDAAQFDARTPHCLAADDEDVELLMVAAPVAAPLFDSHIRSGR
ncbi:helix-turn-helix domain-containing protein [Spirillospora sp. NPDC127200]